jgi:hypothetical protein
MYILVSVSGGRIPDLQARSDRSDVKSGFVEIVVHDLKI